MDRKTSVGAFALAATLFSATLLAQSERGTITGTVLDATGAVVPGALEPSRRTSRSRRVIGHGHRGSPMVW